MTPAPAELLHGRTGKSTPSPLNDLRAWRFIYDRTYPSELLSPKFTLLHIRYLFKPEYLLEYT